MGESIMAASTTEDKIGGNAGSNRRLEVSVSFGRFENDTLSWEKWSSFSQNKYLEEVEKCATPGSVAQKKAYFEAHYKKIASRKAQKLDQKTVETGSPWKNHQNSGDSAGFNVSNGQTARGTEQEPELDGELGSNSGENDELNEDATVNIQSQDLLAERVVSPTLNKLEEDAGITQGETQSLELPNELDKEIERISKFREEPAKFNTAKESRKISPSSKVRDLAKIWKRPASPIAKTPQVSTTKISKTVITSNTTSTQRQRTPTKKVTGSPPPKNKICSVGGTKKVAPKSLHMSLAMDTSGPDPDPDPDPSESAPFTAARKSFIMEKMKDKEIVKRAFKTFQNNFNQLRSSAEERSLPAKQVPTKGSEIKVSSSITPRKENAGTLKAVNMDKKTAKTAPSFGLKSYERAEKSNEKLHDKSKGKQSESTRLQTKSKEEKDSDIRKSRYNLNFRTSPVLGFYQGQKVLRSSLDKEGSKTLGV